ncbi:MAG: hypothetical protein U0X73_08325 [Thermoanaerobaculia bacterium]
MSAKPIQEQFGEKVIEAFADFARSELKAPDQLEGDEFSHISDTGLRKDLAQVFYGARWLYKLGLALLTRDEERAAHVRAQLLDYGSLVEGLLAHCVAHAVRTKQTTGDAFKWRDPDKKQQPINWNVKDPEAQIGRQSFWWLIRVAWEFAVVPKKLREDLDWLREQRNTVHLRQRSALGQTAYLNHSKRAFELVIQTIAETKAWKATHP